MIPQTKGHEGNCTVMGTAGGPARSSLSLWEFTQVPWYVIETNKVPWLVVMTPRRDIHEVLRVTEYARLSTTAP